MSWVLTSFSIVVVFLVASRGVAASPPLRPAVAGCNEEVGAAAFATFDISRARAELAVFKDKAKPLRDCAIKVWQSNIDKLLAIDPLFPIGGSARSEVLERTGTCTSVARVSDGSWLDIPRVQETVVCIAVPDWEDKLIVLEQDGFLRAFDMATALWPPGYFVALWLASRCHVVAGQRVLELAAGVGGPSIVASLCGARSVLATEKDLHALVNIRVNARNNAAPSIETGQLDWFRDDHLEAIAARGPFDIVLAAGTGPHHWAPRLGVLLRRLVRPDGGKVVLCQRVGDFGEKEKDVLRGFHFEVEEVMDGDAFGLAALSGGPSEFELFVLSSRHRVHLGAGLREQ